jgi:hypothetical protein
MNPINAFIPCLLTTLLQCYFARLELVEPRRVDRHHFLARFNERVDAGIVSYPDDDVGFLLHSPRLCDRLVGGFWVFHHNVQLLGVVPFEHAEL